MEHGGDGMDLARGHGSHHRLSFMNFTTQMAAQQNEENPFNAVFCKDGDREMGQGMV